MAHSPAPMCKVVCRPHWPKPLLEERWHAQRDGEVCRPSGGGRLSAQPPLQAETLQASLSGRIIHPPGTGSSPTRPRRFYPPSGADAHIGPLAPGSKAVRLTVPITDLPMRGGRPTCRVVAGAWIGRGVGTPPYERSDEFAVDGGASDAAAGQGAYIMRPYDVLPADAPGAQNRKQPV